MKNNKIRIAIQKSGRLQEDSIKLLKECGLSFNVGKNQLKTPVQNLPIELLFLRDDDIPEYVQDNVADLGIVGENVWLEKNKNTDLFERLGFARCRLSLAVPREKKVDSVQWFQGKKIATSYPTILQEYFAKLNIAAEVHEISGSVEIAPGIGLSDGICDIVSSGSTLLSNGLKEVETVMKSEAVLIANKNLSDTKLDLIDRLKSRIEAVNNAKNNKYVLLNAPNKALDEIANVLPGMRSPTILPLKEEGWSSVHSVMSENDFWDVIDQLKKLGAQGILVVPIEKMIVQ